MPSHGENGVTRRDGGFVGGLHVMALEDHTRATHAGDGAWERGIPHPESNGSGVRKYKEHRLVGSEIGARHQALVPVRHHWPQSGHSESWSQGKGLPSEVWFEASALPGVALTKRKLKVEAGVFFIGSL